MKTLRILSLLIVAALMFSCEKDIKDEEKTGEVSFGIEHIDPLDLKNDNQDWPYCQDDMVPVIAEIEIILFHGTTEEETETFTPQVFYLDGELYSQAIKLPSGEHKITKFLLRNAANEIIMATPLENAPFSEFITPGKTMSFDFTVGVFTKTQVEIEVLCFIEHNFDNFGFTWFYIDEIIVREMCFFGDLCHKDPDDYAGTIYDDVFDLDAYPFDLPALFEVKIIKGAQSWTYKNWDDNNNFIAPLCVKYPDLVRVDEEVFTFELYVYVPVGDAVLPVLYETWTLTEELIGDEMLLDWSGLMNEFDVVEFVIGNCNTNPNVIVFPPYLNLPNTATIKVNHPGDPGYWYLDISNPIPGGTYDLPIGTNITGWCGDEDVTIGNNSIHTMNIYTSLHDTGWPGNMPWTVQDIAKVNWLFNNLGTFDGYNTLTPPYITASDLTKAQGDVIQEAIWGILDGKTVTGDANTMKSAASSKGDFVPLPGGWAAVLCVPGDDPDSAQLIFTVVDP